MCHWCRYSSTDGTFMQWHRELIRRRRGLGGGERGAVKEVAQRKQAGAG
jgi:hypothetical protein